MPNSFTVLPNVLPGNVTIGGNLTVSGDQLRIGAASPFVRLGKDGSGFMLLSQNIQFDDITRDAAGAAAFGRLYVAPNAGDRPLLINTAGNQMTMAALQVLFSDSTSHSHTGTTTEDTIYSRVIRANTLANNSILHLYLRMLNSAQAAGAPTLRLKFGAGNTVNAVTFAAATSYDVHLYTAYQNSSSACAVRGVKTNLSTGTVEVLSTGGSTDITADETFSVTIQNVTAGDSQAFEIAVLELLNSFGPV